MIINFWFDIWNTQRCWLSCKFERHDIWRRDSQNPPLQITQAFVANILCTIYTRLTIKITKKNRICRFFKKHRYLRGIFDEIRLDWLFLEWGFFGGRTSLFLSSQRMPSRYALHLQYHTLSIILPHKNSTNNVICVDILMRCAVNSIFDCAGVFATTYN